MRKPDSQNIRAPLSNKIQSLEEVLPEDTSFRNASYQICKNWLKAREGRVLSHEDSQQYKRIVMILKDMVKLTEEIKTAIQCYHFNKMEIFEKVRVIVVEKLEIEPERVTPTANFAKDLGADSLDTLELVIALEETFNIEISAQVAQTLLTVQQTIDYISQKLNLLFECKDSELLQGTKLLAPLEVMISTLLIYSFNSVSDLHSDFCTGFPSLEITYGHFKNQSSKKAVSLKSGKTAVPHYK